MADAEGTAWDSAEGGGMADVEDVAPAAGMGGSGDMPAGRAQVPRKPPAAGSRGPAAARGGRHRLWRAVFFALAAAAIAGAVTWAFLGSRFLIVRFVKVAGSSPLVSRERVLAAAGIPIGQPLIRVNPGAVARRVELIPQVLSARVHRDWPDAVAITVVLRTPVFAVPDGGRYELVDPHGVDVRTSARRPPGLPLLVVPAGQGGSLRGNPAVHAAAVVLRELPGRIGKRVRSVTADNPSEVTLRLTSGVVIVWGDTSRPAEKAKELAVLMRTHARYYDVSAPGTAVTRR